jgi:hypothetical protein
MSIDYSKATLVETTLNEADIRDKLGEYEKILDVDSCVYFISSYEKGIGKVNNFVVFDPDIEKLDVSVAIIKSIILDLDKTSTFSTSQRYS